MFDFTGKVVLVTGGSGNLGGAVVRAFAAAGASLVVPDRRQGRLAQLFPDLANGAHALLDGVDVITPPGAAQTVQAALDRCGRIDVVINTVGGYAAGQPVHETAPDTWDLMLDLNAKSVFTISRAVLPTLLAQGSGVIISTGAKSALAARATESAYAASKAALARLTESMAAEYGGKGIRANLVLPGIIDTPENRAAMPKADFSKWIRPEQIADVMCFLASEAGRVINGALIPVYG
ncbi:MAG: SDR family NAD(P)-dependent oxidoreductase [Anaerolineae bacterium]|nr:SDR family NAD(P)-dependent oxidoreductase [Anaerolineae bacterium]